MMNDIRLALRTLRQSPAHRLRDVLFGVHTSDYAALAGTAVALTCVGTLACFVPARRAASGDPMIALRAE